MADRKAIARRLWGKKCCTQAASTFKRVSGLTARQPDSPGAKESLDYEAPPNHDSGKFPAWLPTLSQAASRVVVRQERPQRPYRTGDFREADFWPASKSAIKRPIHSAVTQAEAAIEIATPLHR